jgi:hypothetical protein
MTTNTIVAEFEERIEAMCDIRPLPDMPVRFKIITDYNDEYLEITGHNLPATMLSKFSDWILLEVLNDKDVDKVSNSEFAILSQRQLRRRDKRECSLETGVMDYLNQKYVKNSSSLAKTSKKESD